MSRALNLKLRFESRRLLSAQANPWSDPVSARLTAAALFAILCVASPLAYADAAPDPYLALQGLLTGDKMINEALINEFRRGYENGHAGRAQDDKQPASSDKTKATSKKLGRGLDEAYKRGFNLGRQDKAIEDKKSSKSQATPSPRSQRSP
jgi:hypothetical protein